jgi:hypothetical protein
MSFGKSPLGDVWLQQDVLMIGRDRYPWRYVRGASVRSLATDRSLGWAIVRLVPATPLFLYGVSYAIYASLEAPHRFAESTVLVTGAIFALLGVLLGGRPVVTCWQFGCYALTIDVAGRKPIKIRPSHRRQAVETRERDINARLVPFMGQIIVSGPARGTQIGSNSGQVIFDGPAQGIQVGDGNTQTNYFPAGS